MKRLGDKPMTGAERQRRYRQQHPEKIHEAQLKRYRDNPEKGRERTRLYRQENPDKVTEYSRRYLQSERGKLAYRLATRRYKAKKHQADGQLSVVDIKHQYARQHGRCYYCHTPVGAMYHVEHAVPISRGGANSPDNIVIACPTCNLRKRAKLPHEWPEGGRLL